MIKRVMHFLILGCIGLLAIIFSGNACQKSSCPKCDSSPDPGPCKASFVRYYYDKKEGKCKEFIWGGCKGVVPFETLEECQSCGCN